MNSLGLNGWSARIAIGASIFFVALFPIFSDDLFFQNMIILSLIYAIGASGLNVISGFAGYVSLGQAAFLGVGAYTVAILTRDVGGSPFVWLPAAGLLGAAFAAGLGVIAMRTRGYSFAIITIAFLFLMQIVGINWDSLTNGTQGLSLPIPTWNVAYQYWPFYYALAALLAVTVLMNLRIRRTKFGMGLIAMREDEDKAATVGINTPVYKILGFVAASLPLSIAGGLYGYYVGFIDPRSAFDIVISVQIVLALMLGGRGTIWGPVLGAFIIEPLNEIANQHLGGGNSRLLIFGGLLALVVLFLPDGIIPSLRKRLLVRRRRGQAATVGARIDAPLTITGLSEAAPKGSVDINDTALLEVRNLKKWFGGVRAIDGCSFTVPKGSITALIGPNGSGKTTSFNLIGGTMRPDAGELRFDGRRIERLQPWMRAYGGIGRTFQITRLFDDLTVLENVVAPLRAFSWRQLNRTAVSGPEAARAQELLDFVGMRAYRDQPARALSYGQKKLVELAQVLMQDPKLILLDEPAGGINPILIERMGNMIRTLNRNGMTFLIVEHNMPFVLGLCDPVLVLARGECICVGTPDEVQRDPKVLDAYLGDDFVLERSAVRAVQ